MLAVILRRAPAALLPAGSAAATGQLPADRHRYWHRSRARPIASSRGGWYPWAPITGFDVEIQRAVERIMGMELVLPKRDWKDHLAALADGRVDIAAGAAFVSFWLPNASCSDDRPNSIPR